MENILEEMMTVILYFVLENGERQRLITEYNNKTKHLFFLSHDVEEKTHHIHRLWTLTTSFVIDLISTLENPERQ